MVLPDEGRYLQSLGLELQAQSTRVRDLIGPVHWLTDGAYKEALLRDLLVRQLPSGIRCVRGFVTTGDGRASTEQDILILDTHSSAPLFQTADFAICFPEAVLAAISVKTKLGRSEICNAVEGLSSLHEVCRDIWTAVFFFDDESSPPQPPTIYQAISDSLHLHQPNRRPVDSPPGRIGPDLICTMTSLTFVSDYAESRIRGFSCNGRAPAVLLAQLLAHIDSSRPIHNGRIGQLLDRFQDAPLDPPFLYF